MQALEKDQLEVLAVTLKPFEELYPRMKTPWPGSIRCQLYLLMPDAPRELQKIARLATHCSRLSFYTT